MAAPGFRAKPEVYDVLWIDNIPMPGEWDCPEIGRAQKLKTPKGSGDDGGSIRVTGLEVTKGTITSKLHTDEDEEVWGELVEYVLPVNRPNHRKELRVTHPQFARHKIFKIVVSRVSEGRPRGGDPMPVRLEWVVAHDKKGKTGKPKKTTPGGRGGGGIAQPTAFDQNGQPVLQSLPPSMLRSNPPLTPEQLQSLPPGKRVLQSLPR